MFCDLPPGRIEAAVLLDTLTGNHTPPADGVYADELRHCHIFPSQLKFSHTALFE
jgi:hypothetical protein